MAKLLDILLGQLPGILLALAVSFFVLQPWERSAGLSEGREQGRAALQSEIATAAAKAEKERVSDDAARSKLSDHDLCIGALRSRGMPIDLCASL